MLMAVFKLIGGAKAVYLVVPLLGGLAVWATFLMGSRLAGAFVGACGAVCSPQSVLSL
jgi:asparagine N-glycosylation enzyme membrane subunit Stt3